MTEPDRAIIEAALREAIVQVRGFAKVMDDNNWRDLRLHIERQTDIVERAANKS